MMKRDQTPSGASTPTTSSSKTALAAWWASIAPPPPPPPAEPVLDAPAATATSAIAPAPATSTATQNSSATFPWRHPASSGSGGESGNTHRAHRGTNKRPADTAADAESSAPTAKRPHVAHQNRNHAVLAREGDPAARPVRDTRCASDLTDTNRQLRAATDPVILPEDQAADEFLASLAPAATTILPPPRPAAAPPIPPPGPLATAPIPAHIPQIPLADLVAELARKSDKAALNHQAKLQHAMLDLTTLKAQAADLVEKVGNLRNVLVSGMDGAHQALCTKLDHATESLLDAIVNAQLPPPPPPAPDLNAFATRIEQYMDARLARLEASMAARFGSTVTTRLDRFEAAVLAKRDAAAAPSPPTGKNAGKRRSPAGVQTNARLFTVERQAQTVLTGRGPTVPTQSKKVGTVMDDACPNCGLYEHGRANCPYPPHECHACGCHGHQIYFCPHVSLLGRARNKKARKRVEAAEALMSGAATATATTTATAAVAATGAQAQQGDDEDVDVVDMDLDDPEDVSSLASSLLTSSSVGFPSLGPGAVTVSVAAPATIPTTAVPVVQTILPSTVLPVPAASSNLDQALEPHLPPPPPPLAASVQPLPMSETDPTTDDQSSPSTATEQSPRRVRRRRKGAWPVQSPPGSPSTTFAASPARSLPSVSPDMACSAPRARSPPPPPTSLNTAHDLTSSPMPALPTSTLEPSSLCPATVSNDFPPEDGAAARQEHFAVACPPALHAPRPPAHSPIRLTTPNAAPSAVGSASESSAPAVSIKVEVQDKGGERTFTMNPSSLF
ncbi:hypothetical protein GGF31_000753 [Allomyces arbusculus]|nr:hypothetical protein GGF31_000753 [Allomyces arbusculus]